MVSRIERHKRAHVDDFGIDAVLAAPSVSAASSARGTISASATMVQSPPARRIFAVPSVSTISPSGTSPFIA